MQISSLIIQQINNSLHDKSMKMKTTGNNNIQTILNQEQMKNWGIYTHDSQG